MFRFTSVLRFVAAGVLLALSCWAFAAPQDLFVTDSHGNAVLRYDGLTGAYLGRFAEVPAPIALAFGPGGDLFVGSQGVDGASIRRFDGVTGADKGPFASAPLPSHGFEKLIFRGGSLYASLFITSYPDIGGSIREYDAASGTELRTVALATGAENFGGMAFGPDGSLYTTILNGRGSARVRRFGMPGGALIGDFAREVSSPFSVALGSDGNLLVDSSDGRLYRYTPDGTPLGAFSQGPALGRPFDTVIGPDGAVYVTDADGGTVVRYDAGTGAYLGNFVAPFSGGLQRPQRMAFGPAGATPVPEPSTASLLLAVVPFLRRRRAVNVLS